MADIMERLRKIAPSVNDDTLSWNWLTMRTAMLDAAAEIERLTETIREFGRGDIVPITDKDAEIDRLRAALKKIENIADTVLGDYELALNQIGHIADEALGNEQKADGQ